MPITTTVVANSVSAFAVIFAGVLTVVFCHLVAPQPRRWLFAYWCVFITGLPTLWFHGFGETHAARVADVGTNLLLAWSMQIAALGDFYSRRTQWIVGGTSGVVIAATILWMAIVGSDASRLMVVSISSGSGYRIMQVVLIASSLLGTILLYARLHRIPPNARPLLYFMTSIFLIGMMFASRRNHDIDGFMAYHAVWHTIAAFGFLVVWAFNHKRFNGSGTAPTLP